MAQNPESMTPQAILGELALMSALVETRDRLRAEAKERYQRALKEIDEEFRLADGSDIDEMIAAFRSELLGLMQAGGSKQIWQGKHLAEVQMRDQILIEDEAAVIAALRTSYPKAIKQELRKAEFNRLATEHPYAVSTVPGWKRVKLPVLVVTLDKGLE